MAIRATVEDVRAIMETSLSDDAVLRFLESAATMMSAILGDNESALNEIVLREIETWLAAHLITVAREPRISKYDIGEVSVTLSEKPGTWLSSTPYGQQVLILDTTGSFASAGTLPAKIASITVMGTDDV